MIAAYSSDGRIAQFDLVVLDDPKDAIPPYDAVLLISPQRANDAALARRAAAAGRRDRRRDRCARPTCAPRASASLAGRGRALAVERNCGRTSVPAGYDATSGAGAQVRTWTLK